MFQIKEPVLAKRNKMRRQQSHNQSAVDKNLSNDLQGDILNQTQKSNLTQKRNRSVLNRKFNRTNQSADPAWSTGIKRLMGRVQQLRGETSYLEHPGDFRPNQPPNITAPHLQDVRASALSPLSQTTYEPNNMLRQFSSSPFIPDQAHSNSNYRIRRQPITFHPDQR